ncbi:pyridoxamine 5'-phosphate oxidase [Weeksella virosa]|uniref:pyridoxamine 5'-phosphate oxidase n=1 Tax=Weeksella virosa TaxID=1014 RepID=UPI000E024FB8|nr:pyridoxamine 5'-phosphate oxidase [Weeksella virosa]MDK7674698.1 pyridoxamine 5'-phosphate oxidase [Weeksella virosa]SUP54664.1 Pyridoxine/pyridoxamine 5'-phosphate oxidase [Weeksella virosa]
MKQDLSDKRKNYSKNFIDFDHLAEDAIEQFKSWFDVAEKNPLIEEANAMTVTTVENSDKPRNRVVLLKEYNQDGFVFYTNYQSQKGKAIENNPRVCLSFFWPALQQQIIITGKAEKVSEEMSDAYFAKRPRESQVGAWVSPQSSVIDEFHDFVDDEDSIIKKYKNQEIPRPPHWGGYLVKPEEIEFWQGRPSRLHDRVLYKKKDNGWKKYRLAP